MIVLSHYSTFTFGFQKIASADDFNDEKCIKLE